MDHSPALRRSYPNRCEPTSSVGSATTRQDVLSGCDRLIRPDGTDLQMVVAEGLSRSPRAPEARSHLRLDSLDASLQASRSHGCRRVHVSGKVDRQFPAIPPGGGRIEHRLDCGGIRGKRESTSRAHLARARRQCNQRHRRCNRPHHFSGTSRRLVPHGSVRIHSPFSSFMG